VTHSEFEIVGNHTRSPTKPPIVPRSEVCEVLETFSMHSFLKKMRSLNIMDCERMLDAFLRLISYF
jgi:hypothetical protein